MGVTKFEIDTNIAYKGYLVLVRLFGLNVMEPVSTGDMNVDNIKVEQVEEIATFDEDQGKSLFFENKLLTL